MLKLNNKQLLWILGGGALIVYFLLHNAKSAGVALGQAAGEAVSGTVQGALNSTTGIPVTNQDKCNAAIAAGDSWNASLYCDVGTYFKYLFNR